MDLSRHPDLLDRLAASYALGTLRGGARRRFEAMARQSPTVRAAALLWQERWASMTELQRPELPGANVWKRIENLIAEERPAAAAAAPPRDRRVRWWQGAAVAGAFATIAAVAVGMNVNAERERLAAQIAGQPDVQYVAVLSDERSSASVLVTVDPKRNLLTLKRVGGFQEGPDKSLQLWALAPAGPQSLGVLGGERVIHMTGHASDAGQAPALAISLEPKGGVPGDKGPTGPVLFKGPVVPMS